MNQWSSYNVNKLVTVAFFKHVQDQSVYIQSPRDFQPGLTVNTADGLFIESVVFTL